MRGSWLPLSSSGSKGVFARAAPAIVCTCPSWSAGLNNHLKLRVRNDETKSTIEQTLVEGAEGMYSSQNYSADLNQVWMG